MFTVMVPILIDKDVVEPNDYDLKAMVWNCSSLCTNLNKKNIVTFIEGRNEQVVWPKK